MTIGSSLAQFAKRKPASPALVCDDEVVTWRDLLEATQAIAHDMDERTQIGASVALVLPNSPSLIAHFLACALSGREAAVIDAAWPPSRVEQALRELSPELVYAESNVTIAPSVEVSARSPLPRRAEPIRARPIDPDSPFYTGFTSGSTGRPKGYRRSHRSWLASFDGDRVEFGVTEADIVLAPGSMTHSLFLYAAVHALQIGATVVMSRSFHPARAWRQARDHAATIAYGAPTQWRMMFDVNAEPLLNLRWVLSSGAKWFADAGRRIAELTPNAQFAEFYGASELSFVAVRKSGEACPEHSVGRAFANVKIRIRDDASREVEPGAIGRVFVESPYLFSGYAGRDELVTTHGVEMSVGDMGFLDESGFLYLVGRRDRMIVTSGKNVFAEEIERALESIPGVRAAAVFGFPDELRGQKIVAFVLPVEPQSLSRSALTRELRRLLPAPFVPRVFAIPREWRWTQSGKTNFEAMRALWDYAAWDELK